MNPKGFTLIELIAIIALLGVVFLVTYTEVTKSIDKSTNELYQAQLSNIKAAAQDWTVDHLDELPEADGDSINVNLSDLIDGGYIDSDIKNIATEKESTNIYVKITRKDNNYIYEVID